MALDQTGFVPGAQPARPGGGAPLPADASYGSLLLPPSPTGPALPLAPPVPAHDAVIPPRVFTPEPDYDDELASGSASTVAPTGPAPVTYPIPVESGIKARGMSSRRGDIAVLIAGIGLGITTAFAVGDAPATWQYLGGPMTALGSITAMAGTYLCLALLVLVARVPWVEREVGHDKLVSLHRQVAPYSLILILAHMVLTTIGYAQAAESGVLEQFWNIVAHSPWMVPATTAFVLMMGLGVMSYRKIRQRMKYETWWVAHLYFYVAVALAFGHQIELGSMFAKHPGQKWFWIGLYVLVAAIIIGSRFIAPISTSIKHDLRVAAVVRETPDVVSIYISGRDLDLLKARGGQFFQWRFLTRHWWWQAHPYSLSASPNSSFLRITVKDLGDQSRELIWRLKPGTRVWAEGPYGVFTAAQRHSNRIAAFAAGVGITPVRAMLEDLPEGADVDVVFRVHRLDSAPLRAELEELAMSRGFRLWYLEGSRRQARLRTDVILEMIPDLADCDVYVCGPDGFTEKVLEAAEDAGVPADRQHHEAFAF
jgi:predicted ferric reductase